MSCPIFCVTMDGYLGLMTEASWAGQAKLPDSPRLRKNLRPSSDGARATIHRWPKAATTFAKGWRSEQERILLCLGGSACSISKAQHFKGCEHRHVSPALQPRPSEMPPVRRLCQGVGFLAGAPSALRTSAAFFVLGEETHTGIASCNAVLATCEPARALNSCHLRVFIALQEMSIAV